MIYGTLGIRQRKMAIPKGWETKEVRPTALRQFPKVIQL